MVATSSETIRNCSSKIKLCSKPNYMLQYLGHVKQYFLGSLKHFYSLTNLVTTRRPFEEAIVRSTSFIESF